MKPGTRAWILAGLSAASPLIALFGLIMLAALAEAPLDLFMFFSLPALALFGIVLLLLLPVFVRHYRVTSERPPRSSRLRFKAKGAVLARPLLSVAGPLALLGLISLAYPVPVLTLVEFAFPTLLFFALVMLVMQPVFYEHHLQRIAHRDTPVAEPEVRSRARLRALLTAAVSFAVAGSFAALLLASPGFFRAVPTSDPGLESLRLAFWVVAPTLVLFGYLQLLLIPVVTNHLCQPLWKVSGAEAFVLVVVASASVLVWSASESGPGSPSVPGPMSEPGQSWEEMDEAYERGDYATVLGELRPRAEHGDALAQYRLGLLYDRGEGLTEDHAEAIKWYRKAADQGYVWAQLNLGWMYDSGEGVRQDNTEAVKWYRKAVDQGNDIAQHNMARVLMEVAREGEADVLTDLIAAGALVDARDRDQGTALLAAAEGGHIGSVEILLANGAEVDVGGGTFRHTPLIGASSGGDEAVVQILLAAGADVAARDNYDATSVHRAAEGGHAGVVGILLASGAEVDAQMSSGWTPLMQAASEGRSFRRGDDAVRRGYTEVIKLLLAAGADPNHHVSNWTVLMRAAGSCHAPAVESLLVGGAAVDAVNVHGVSALFMGIACPSPAGIQALLLAGAKVDARNNIGFTPLMVAAGRGGAEAVDALLGAGAQVNAKANNGSTALMAAAVEGHTAICQVLLRFGANIGVRNADGSTASELAETEGHIEVVELLSSQ